MQNVILEYFVKHPIEKFLNIDLLYRMNMKRMKNIKFTLDKNTIIQYNMFC